MGLTKGPLEYKLDGLFSVVKVCLGAGSNTPFCYRSNVCSE